MDSFLRFCYDVLNLAFDFLLYIDNYNNLYFTL